MYENTVTTVRHTSNTLQQFMSTTAPILDPVAMQESVNYATPSTSNISSWICGYLQQKSIKGNTPGNYQVLVNWVESVTESLYPSGMDIYGPYFPEYTTSLS